MPNPNDPTPPDPKPTDPTPPAGNNGGGQPDPATPPAGNNGGDDLTDKHGEPAINRGRYDRDIAAKDAEIEALKKQLEEATGKAKTGEDALKRVEQLEARLADEKLTHTLDQAGCVNAKAAKALLGDYEGDVGKLKEACPYLFGAPRQQGSTGAKPQGAPTPTDELVRRAREAVGTAYLYEKK